MKQSFSLFLLFFTSLFGQETLFAPFTGRVLGNKVRIRLEADLNSPILRQAHRDEVLLVVGEKEGFWAVKPEESRKCYVYRTYILDEVVEANRVNVRLFPSTDAPIVSRLEMGEKVQGAIEKDHPKWYAIDCPENLRFYIDKTYVRFIGANTVYASLKAKQTEAEKALKKAYALLKEEVKKPSDKMRAKAVMQEFEAFISHYKDFPGLIKEARIGLISLQENYTKKKIQELEASTEEKPISIPNLPASLPKKVEQKTAVFTKSWENKEEALYGRWKKTYPNLSKKTFYEKQKLSAKYIEGFLEKCSESMKSAPGDFVIKLGHQTIGYVYSTKLNLAHYQGKKIRFLVSPRDNNHYAFPAYFVLDVH